MAINEGLTEELRAAVQHLPNPVMITMLTSLNARNFDYDISAYLRPGLHGPLDFDNAFWFGGAGDYSIDVQIDYYRKIMERNAISRRVAADLNVPVIDLASALDTERLPDFRQDFYDIIHPRPSAYPKVARIMADELCRLRIL